MQHFKSLPTGEAHSAVEKYLPVEHHLPPSTSTSTSSSSTTSSNSNKALVCPIDCPEDFDDEQQLTHHFRSQHGFSQVFFVPVCLGVFIDVLFSGGCAEDEGKKLCPEDKRRLRLAIHLSSNITSVLHSASPSLNLS